MTMTVTPYEAVGPLRYGMSHDEIAAMMGPPVRIVENRSGNPVLWYKGFNATVENNSLVEVGFGPDGAMTVLGIAPLSDPDGFSRLCEIDGNPQEVLGFIVLLNLGVTLTGFHDNDESQKAITAFARDRWDAHKAKMKPYPLTAQ